MQKGCRAASPFRVSFALRPGRLTGKRCADSLSEQTRGVAQLGRAPGLGPGGRGFESRHPDRHSGHLLDGNASYMQRKIPTSVVIGRIASIVGLSFAVAIGILLLLTGAYWLLAAVSLLLALPFAALLRFVEYRAEQDNLRGS